jgi:antitoxin component of MazEF toxin-antitoxin module
MVECEGKIKLEISDNIKLSLKDYRSLIYKIVEKYEGMQKEDLTKSLTKSNEQSNIIQNPTIKTLYKGRPSKVVRSASKGKDDSIPKSNHKESNTVNIKKYSSYLSKGKDDLFRTKYAKTEEV